MQWMYKPEPPSDLVEKLANELKIDTLLAQLLVQRGITTFEEARIFFRPTWADLHNPFLMKDMQKAIHRIDKAIENNENIMIFGDYDVDGTTAVSLVYSFFKDIYPNITTYIPDRYTEGYGVSAQGIDFADDNNIRLIIALDCGIKSADKVAYALEKSIDFIICDHHNPDENLPKAVAILNPKQLDCPYPYKELCGCGIGFKLIQAYIQHHNQDEKNLLPYTDLVATAIAADIVPMTGENRILAKFGLEQINSNPREGIKALLENRKKKVFTISDIVFHIAPRINAAGRIKHGNEAVKLLTEYGLEEAQQFASELENYNTERKEFDQQITLEALQQIENNHETERFSTVVFNENWHKGVIGIVASRLTETYYRPTLVFTKTTNGWAASARSVQGFDLYAALEKCQEYLVQFGGHMYAAGLTLLDEQLLPFKEKFEEVVKQSITTEQQVPTLTIDAEINFTDINPKFIRILKQMEPFGPQNMTPVFASKNIFDTGYAQQLGANKEHLKAFVKQNLAQEGYSMVGFGLGDYYSKIQNQQPFTLAYTLEENEWNGSVQLQLSGRDLKIQ